MEKITEEEVRKVIENDKEKMQKIIDEGGKISFSTENFYSGIHTVYITYEDKVDNYTTNITFIVDTRER